MMQKCWQIVYEDKFGCRVAGHTHALAAHLERPFDAPNLLPCTLHKPK